MKPYSLVISLLLLSLFLTKAQGIRLEKGSFAAQQHKQHDQEESNLLKKTNNGANKEAIVCKDEQYCTGTLKKRASRVSRKPKNQLPHIHEDYSGPRHHRPRHH
ncbi:hypothetical protein AAZX31_09G088000 [Glycine max]|uniref:Uncharacterized protein n=2 Tax=Glycine subgen. Soja TaxID=1462606 RepID=K7LCS6_SOYBN|nr:uncharacterized protein LOC121172752 [Glycine max]KAG4991030.1 hypothetical protein JHK87_024487 [Glycine soja]KAG5006573.1 hypothetical protein JHK85_025115 [Glycine max]KAG5012354.1 hypothetical protein JHK86_024615 [Glycine max]KAG5133329.1 hypothetical protein JHK82_024517 [Glycine max]KAH1042260.1 hypothetical protein GYH30_024526 [Glycine max]